MAVVAIGDIHGNLAALQDLLAQLRPELRDDDTLVFLGDYIDRGPATRGCIDTILALCDERPDRVVCLCGNHEDWMLRTREDHARHSWLMVMDAWATIRSYSPDAEQLIRAAMRQEGAGLFLSPTPLPYEAFFDAMPDSHHQFFDGLGLTFEAEGCVFSHAGVDPAVPEFVDQNENALLWGTLGFPHRYTGEATVIYGHWNNAIRDADGWPHPKILANSIGIDTSAHGVLTAIRLPDRHVFQSAKYPVALDDEVDA